MTSNPSNQPTRVIKKLIIMSKECIVCKEAKPLDMFEIRETSRDGYRNQCKDCRNIMHRKVYQRRKHEPHYLERGRRKSFTFIKRHPQKAIAHRLAHRAELIGDKCSNCARTDDLHMHHPDYSKPLEVITLCVPCHVAVHTRGLKV